MNITCNGEICHGPGWTRDITRGCRLNPEPGGNDIPWQLCRTIAPLLSQVLKHSQGGEGFTYITGCFVLTLKSDVPIHRLNRVA